MLEFSMFQLVPVESSPILVQLQEEWFSLLYYTHIKSLQPATRSLPSLRFLRLNRAASPSHCLYVLCSGPYLFCWLPTGLVQYVSVLLLPGISRLDCPEDLVSQMPGKRIQHFSLKEAVQAMECPACTTARNTWQRSTSWFLYHFQPVQTSTDVERSQLFHFILFQFGLNFSTDLLFNPAYFLATQIAVLAQENGPCGQE